VRIITRLSTVLGLALALAGIPTAFAAEGEADGRYIEEIIVQAERGDVNVLDRAMSVTGFNQAMIEQLGMENADDLVTLVPGLEMGNRTHGGGKGEDDHFYMRGIGSERTVNFFSDTSVAVYIDGVYTDQTYSTDGLFDVERVEVARGPQGTTGGRSAMAGSINFHTRKPTDEFDMQVRAEMNDISTQRYRMAFGGPIGDSNFSYRIGGSYTTGDGTIENKGFGPDGGEPDQTIFSPQLRWKNDRWDVLARYSNQADTGTPRVSLPLGARNTLDEFNMVPDGMGNLVPNCPVNPNTGLEECQRNPYFGTEAAPSVAGCSNINADGTRDELDIICSADDLRHEISLNAPLSIDNSAESASLDVTFALTDTLTVNYKYGWRDIEQNSLNDSDQLNRVGGGICPFNHPKVLSGQLTEGQSSRYCALDGGGVGAFLDSRSHYIFTSEQTSHEISLYSGFDGPFNFTVGAVYIDGEEPYIWQGYEYGSGANDWQFADTSAACNAMLPGLLGTGGLLEGDFRLTEVYSNPAAQAHVGAAGGGGSVYACPGSPEVAGWSNTSDGSFAANPQGQNGAFYGGVDYDTAGYYFNAEYDINETWKVFGGVRDDTDTKGRGRGNVSYGSIIAVESDGSVFCSANVCNDGVGIIAMGVRDSGIAGFEAKDDVEWGKTTWNVGVEFRPWSDKMIYGRISTGYRAGGIGGYGNLTGENYSYDEEEVTNYETGIKGLFFDGKVQLSATYFYQDFDSYWVFASRLRTEDELLRDPGAGPLTGEVNAIDGTEIQGIELEGAWNITDRLTVRGFYNWLDTSVGDYAALYPYAVPGQGGTWVMLPWTDSNGNAQISWIFGSPEPLQYGGKQLPAQPEHKGSLTAIYDAPLPGDMGSLEIVATASYTGDKFVELGNFDAYAVDDYMRMDLRANWRSPSQAYTVTLYVQNALDEAALHMWSPREGTGSPWGTVVEPREIGVHVTWQI
jgi:outer membrane receptor protein involved in Fe transport